MTDLAFIVDTSDAALPAGRAAAPVSNDSAGAGSFSGMLGERLQSGLQRRPHASETSPQTSLSNTNTVTESGVAEPLDGKPLPLLPSHEEVSPLDSTQAGLADAALLAAITQSVPRDLTSAVVTTAVDSSAAEVESDVDLLTPSTLPGGLLNTLGEAAQAVRAETQATQPKADAVFNTQSPAANIAKQLMLAKSNGLAAEKQDARPDSSRVHAANITPSLLTQPISESAQRALVLAMNDAGLGKRVTPGITAQTEVSQTLGARQSGVSPLSNGLSTAMQLTAVTAKTASNAGFEASAVAARLTQQSAPSLTSVTPLAVTSSANDVSGLLPVGPSSNTTVGGGFMPTLSVATPVGQAGWANEMGQRVAWLAQGELREAQLQLHPRSLGPVEVRIAYGHEQQLNVSFSAANPVAREALDAALPRLREMFEQQGLNLADANISKHSFSDQHHPEGEEGESNSNLTSWSSDTEELTEHAALSNHLLMGDGMLDAYA